MTDQKTLIFDIETDGLLDSISKIHCIVIKNPVTGFFYEYYDQKPEGGLNIKDGVTALAKADRLVGHNIVGFDLPAIKKVFPSFAPVGSIYDTLVVSRLFWPDMKPHDWKRKFKDMPVKLYGRHSLESWGYRLGFHKGEFGKTTDWQKFSQEMVEYCRQDVEVTAKLFSTLTSKKYSQHAINLEHEFAHIIKEQEAFGWPFDEEKAEALVSKLSKRRLELEQELQETFPPRVETMKSLAYYTAGDQQFSTKKEAKAAGYKDKDIAPGPYRTKEHPFNPASTQQIADRLMEKYGWEPQELTETGDPAVTEEVLSSLEYPEAEQLKEYLMLNKRISQVAEGKGAWLKLATNGRIYGRVITNGCVTGRCTHKDPNLAQVPATRSPYGHECRSLFTAPKDWVLVGWDADGLELRCLAHYMASFDSGNYARIVDQGEKEKGTDVHTLNQKAAGLPTRDEAKTFIYAFLYGAGDAKIGKIVGGEATAGRKLKEKFFKQFPALRKLQERVQAVADDRPYLLGLDGRKVEIRSKHAALNTLLQSAGAIVMKQAAILQDTHLRSYYKKGKDWCQVGNIHDEIQIACKPEIADEVGKAGMKAIEQTGRMLKMQCPLRGDYKVGPTWAETH